MSSSSNRREDDEARILGSVRCAAGVLLLLSLILGGCMRSLIYYPTGMTAADVERLASAYGARAERLSVGDQVELSGVRRDGPDGTPLLLFFGGNAMALAESVAVLHEVAGATDWRYAVWAYRGYDGSGGAPSQKALFADALREVRHLAVPHERLFLIGQSLGTGVAVHAAATMARAGEPPAGVVLLSPYTSIRRVANEAVGIPVGWLLADTFETERELPAIASPTLILHGARDDIIGIDHGREIAGALGDRATLVELPSAGHNDLWADPRTRTEIRSFVAARTRN